MDRKTVLVADDDKNVRGILTIICEQAGCETLQASNGKEAIEMAKKHRPDLILMDGMMPEMNGFEATGVLKKDPRTENIPVIIVTGLQSREDRLKGIGLGANDFLTKPFDREEIILRIRNHLKIKEYGDFLRDHNTILERRVTERTRDLNETLNQLNTAYTDTIYRLIVVSELKDEDTGIHIQRIGYYCKELSLTLGLGSSFAETAFHAARMHDIGKVGIPDSILLKKGRLSEEEWEIMRAHTTTGARILQGAGSEYLKMGEQIALTHHERWNGSGYPRGLAGEAIPISGRIANVADVYDALRSRRPYKAEMTHQEAMRIMKSGDDRVQPEHFCPEVIAGFIEKAPRFREIYEDLKELPQELIPLE